MEADVLKSFFRHFSPTSSPDSHQHTIRGHRRIVGEFVAATEGVAFSFRMSAGIFRTPMSSSASSSDDHGDYHGQIARLVERRALRWQSQTEHIKSRLERREICDANKPISYRNDRLDRILCPCLAVTRKPSQQKGYARSVDADRRAQFAFAAIWVPSS
jgi:hypothetical protein